MLQLKMNYIKYIQLVKDLLIFSLFIYSLLFKNTYSIDDFIIVLNVDIGGAKNLESLLNGFGKANI